MEKPNSDLASSSPPSIGRSVFESWEPTLRATASLPRIAPSTRSMAAGSTLAFLARVFAAGMGFANAALAARILGPYMFGLYSLALTMVTVATTIVSGGLQNTLLTLLPRRSAYSEVWAQETLGFAFWYAFGAGTTLALLTAFFGESIARALGQPDNAPLLAVMMFSLPFGAVLATLRAGAQSAYSFWAAILPMDFVRPLILFGGYLVVFLVGAKRAEWVSISYTASAVVAAGVAIAVTASQPTYGWKWLLPTTHTDVEVVALSVPFLFIALLNNLNDSIMVFILGLKSTASEVGLFSAAQRIATLVSFILAAVNTVFAPTIAAVWTRGTHEQLERYFREITRWVLAVSLPICLVLVFAAPGLLGIFGDEFRAASPALVFLALGQLVNAAVGSVAYLLMLTGHRGTVVWNMLGALSISVIAGSMIAPIWGATGAASVAGGTMVGVNLLMLYQVYRKLSLFPYTRDTGRTLVAGLAAAATGAALQHWAWNPANSWGASVIVVTLVISVTYGAAFHLVGMRDGDWHIVRQVVAQLVTRCSRGTRSTDK